MAINDNPRDDDAGFIYLADRWEFDYHAIERLFAIRIFIYHWTIDWSRGWLRMWISRGLIYRGCKITPGKNIIWNFRAWMDQIKRSA